MTIALDAATRDRLRAAYVRHSTDPKYAPVLAEADARGYRLAEGWEREWLAPRDLYSWRGTVWVRCAT